MGTLPAGLHLIQLSGPKANAQVEGVVRTSSDGSHVYFVATEALTGAETNGLGQHAALGAENLYGVDTETGALKFVADLAERDHPLWNMASAYSGAGETYVAEDYAQTTPEGRYLVFSTFAHLASEDRNEARAAYRYDFETGALIWISAPPSGFGNEGQSAEIAPLPVKAIGAYADIDDWNRAVSTKGEDVIFTTAERLSARDVNGKPDVYLWHCAAPCADPEADAEVSLISDGQSGGGVDRGVFPLELRWPAMSADGSNIFFFTSTGLAPQDTDGLQDLYDARVNGGVEQVAPPASCFGEECQGVPQSPSPLGRSAAQHYPAAKTCGQMTLALARSRLRS